MFSRRDVSCVLPYWLDLESNQLLDTKVVLVKEFRSPVRNDQGYVFELPGGSAHVGDYSEIAVEELHQETGLRVDVSRLQQVHNRQLQATLSTHKAMLYSVRLTEAEISQAESNAGKVFGVEKDSERTYVKVKRLRDILECEDCDWSTIGMILNGISAGSSS